ncbi:MAG: hypothetical protein HY791_26455 [Deltaproteobacteria bacterium]|nr:hypothetical protein [Deltaproteobacteria bacterium]
MSTSEGSGFRGAREAPQRLLEGSAGERSFVRSLVQRFWEREPFMVRGVIPPPTTPEGLFSLLVRVASGLRTSELLPRGVGTRLYRGTIPLEFDEDGVLPRPSDLDFDEFCARVGRREHGADCGVVVRGCSFFDERIHESVTRLTRGVAEELGGLPGGMVEVSLFAGAYTRTPFGIHQDDLGVFLMPVVGTKEVRIWPKELDLETVRKMRERRPEELEAPWVFEVTPSDVLYFPRGFWHVTRSLSGYCASVSVGFGPEREELILRALPPSVAREVVLPLGESVSAAPIEICPLYPADWPRSIERLPPPAERIRSWAKDLSGEKQLRLLRELRRWWLKRVSLVGASVSPPIVDVGELGNARVRVRRPVPFLEEDEVLIVAASGRLFEVPALPQLRRLLLRLREGESFSVRSLLRSYARKLVTSEGEFVATRPGIERVLEMLVSFGAVEIST